MISLILRITLAIALAFLLAFVGVKGNAAVLQTLFTVLGIVFSISMSLLVSFSLSKILNETIRRNLRYAIEHTRNMLLFDFGLSTFVLVTALIWNENQLNYPLGRGWNIDIMLVAVALIAASLIYEIYNFRKLHRLHTEIEDAVIKEETDRAQR